MVCYQVKIILHISCNFACLVFFSMASMRRTRVAEPTSYAFKCSESRSSTHKKVSRKPQNESETNYAHKLEYLRFSSDMFSSYEFFPTV